MGYSARLLWFLARLPPLTAQLFTYQELFAGEQAWSGGMRMLGYVGRSYDVRYGEQYDFLTPVGFLTVLWTVMCMHAGSVFLVACPCRSWIWISLGTTLRHLNVLGDLTNPMIRAQNALVCRTIYVLVLCIKRGIYWLLEQPASSALFRHPRWLWLIKRFGRFIRSIKFDMGAWRVDCVKSTILVGTAPYIEDIGRRLTSNEREVVRMNEDGNKTK